MSTFPFMDDYSSEDYEDCDDDYCFVPVATEESVYEAVESDTDLEPEDAIEEYISEAVEAAQAAALEAVEAAHAAALEAETAVKEVDAIEESCYKAVESDSDLEAEEDVVEEGADAVRDGIEESSEATTTSGAAAPSWTSLAPVWATLAVMESTADSPVPMYDVETFLSCSPMVMLQECRTALISGIGTFLREVARLRIRLRRFVRALFCKSETRKYA